MGDRVVCKIKTTKMASKCAFCSIASGKDEKTTLVYEVRTNRFLRGVIDVCYFCCVSHALH